MNAKNSNNLLITGGCGFIGANLVKYLLQEGGYRIKIFDNLSTGRKEYIHQILNSTSPTRSGNSTNPMNPTNPSVDFIEGDIRDINAVKRACEGISAIVHLAAITGVPDSIKEPVKTYEVNVTGTQNLLEAARKTHIKRFVFASSNAAVGEKQPPIHEQMVPHPISPYGASKLAGEALCSAYYHSFGIYAISLRFANVYGPYSEHKTSVIPKFIRRAKKGKALVIYGDGHQTRDFIHAHDIARAIDLALNYDPINATKRNKRFNANNAIQRNKRFNTNNPKNPTNSMNSINPMNSTNPMNQTNPKNPTNSKNSINPMNSTNPINSTNPMNQANLVFQIGTGIETKIINLAEMVKNLAIQSGLNPPEIVFEEPRKGEIRKNYADISKAKELLGFQPEIEVKQGVKIVWDGLS